jgi:23S rRNA (uracil1939-C5)-methyltransferase
LLYTGFFFNLIRLHGKNMGNQQKGRSVTVQINDLSKKGNGLGIAELEHGPPLRVEVPFTMPGDVVRAHVHRKRSGVYAGILEELITPSPNRIAPRCAHFGVCGGCRFQHMSYEQQLSYKEAQVRQYFEKLITPDVSFKPIIGSQSPWQYRNKMEYSFSSDAAGKKYLGLVMDSSRGKVLNITECHLTNPWFVEALKCVRSWWQESNLDAYNMYRDKGSLRTLTLREGLRTGDRMVVLTVSGNPEYALHKQHLESFVAFLRAAIEPVDSNSCLSIFLRIQQIATGMTTNIYEMHLYGADHIRETLHIQVNPQEPPTDILFKISPSAFFQPNSGQAEVLYSTALRLAEIPKDAVVYDLYCGTGALGLCISKYVKQVVGIELSPESALDARNNAKQNGCNNLTIISGAVRHTIQYLQEQNMPPPDVVMVDPPRPGLDPDALKSLLKLSAPKILYISCNPSTQALNVEELVQNGYRIVAIQPVDEFPQTYHVENIVLLAKS